MSAKDAALRRIGPYRRVKVLGQGGMGVVYRAADDAAGREVAVKLVRAELAEDASFRRRLAREVATMRRVDSPYVARVLDADVSGERPYIVTRFIDGQPLDTTIRATGALSGAMLTRVATGLADAVAAIHEAGVIHRDLKPSNVMLVDGAPVVIDFGIAHAADMTRITRTGLIVGTPGYLGPEVLAGGEPGPEVDVYGWAATVAFAATGRSPFGVGSLEVLVARAISGHADLDGVPPRLLPLLRAALSRDPRVRPMAAWLATAVREADPGASAAPTILTSAGRADPLGAVARPGTTEPTAAVLGPAALPGTAEPTGMAEPTGAARTQVEAGRTEVEAGPSVPGGTRQEASRPVTRLIAYVLIATAALGCGLVPTVGVGAAVVAAWYLRAGDIAMRTGRLSGRGIGALLLAPVRDTHAAGRSMAILLPGLAYAGLLAGAIEILLIVWNAGRSGWNTAGYATWPLVGARWSAVAYAWATLAAPGVRGPRRQAARLLSAVASRRRAAVTAGLVAAGLAVLTGWAVLTWRPHWWPLASPYGLLRQLAAVVVGRLGR